MRRVTAVCVGTSPLQMNRFSIGYTHPKGLSPEGRAAQMIYRNDNGKIVLPSALLFKSLVNAYRTDKRREFRCCRSSDFLLETLHFEDDAMILASARDGEQPAWICSKHPGSSFAGKKHVAILSVFPQFDDWAFNVNFLYDEKVVLRPFFVKLFVDAGSKGIGASLLTIGGAPYGHFRVLEWHETTVIGTEQDLRQLNEHQFNQSALRCPPDAVLHRSWPISL